VLRELTVVEQRYLAVMEVIRDGWKVIEVAERHGVSRQSVHAWLRRYQEGGLEALADLPSAGVVPPSDAGRGGGAGV
jgi:transposase-like protein